MRKQGIEIKRAKLELYHRFMQAHPDELTEGDLDIMAALAKDPEIQAVFEENRRK